jgi:hypothetical protein
MAVMTAQVLPTQVVRISSDRAGNALPLPAARGACPALAPLLPIQRNRRARQAVPARRLTSLAVAFGVSLLMWLAIIAAVVALGGAL